MPLSLVGVVWVTVNNFCTFRKMFLPQVCTQAAWNNILFSFVTSTKWTYQKYGRDQKLRFVLWCHTLNDYKAFLWVTIGKDGSFSDRNSVRIYFWREIKLIFVTRREIPRIVQELMLKKRPEFWSEKKTTSPNIYLICEIFHCIFYAIYWAAYLCQAKKV